MKRQTLIVLILMSGSFLFGQNLIPKNTLLTDWNYFVKTLGTSHPDPYTAFGGKIEFHRKTQNIRNNFPQEGLSQFDFANLISRFISHLNDGHTYINIPENHSNDTLQYLLPVKFNIAFDGAYISSTVKDNKNLLGCKLLSIENISVDSLLTKVRLLKGSENIFGTYLNLTKILAQQKTTRQLFPAMNNSLTFEVQLVNKKTDYVKIKYYPENELKEKAWSEFSNYSKISPVGKLIDYKFIDKHNKIAYLGWYHTIMAREGLEMINEKYIDVNLNAIYGALDIQKPIDNNEAIKAIPSIYESFSKVLNNMKKNRSTHLIIDLRYNPGGWTKLTIPVLYMLFGDKYFEFNPAIEYNRLISELYLKKFNQTIEQFNSNRQSDYQIGDYAFGGFFRKDTTISVLQRRNRFLDNQQKSGYSTMNYIENLNGTPIYKPQIIILTAPKTFSAAFHFLYFLTEIGDAKIVGVPSSQAGNTFMESTNFELPNTHLQGSISNTHQIFYPNSPEKGTILKPDFPMNWELYKKYSFDNNAEIMYILDLIKYKKS